METNSNYELIITLSGDLDIISSVIRLHYLNLSDITSKFRIVVVSVISSTQNVDS
jgi:hypothetical protein